MPELSLCAPLSPKSTLKEHEFAKGEGYRLVAI